MLLFSFGEKIAGIIPKVFSTPEWEGSEMEYVEVSLTLIFF